MASLLLELLSEEIPARMQDDAAAALARLFKDACEAAGMGPSAVSAFATPRRLCLIARDLPDRQEDRVIERRGPRLDAPEKARAGFLASLAGRPFELLEQDDRKGRYLLARIREEGRATRLVLSDLLPDLLARMPWPKAMRWGSGEARWVRPLHGILCLLDGAVVPFSFAGIASGSATRGHRFMAPASLEVTDAADYLAQLLDARVIVDGAERRRRIERQARLLAGGIDRQVRDDERLMTELKGLVEWPVALIGRIDARFMELPEEVLVTSMREHQKFLALEDSEGRLAPHFITIANIEAPDGGAAIIAGNERVLRARLWDAAFFWEQDRKQPLEDMAARLDDVVFHADLGSLGDKVGRIERLARELAQTLAVSDRADADPQAAARAARLCKADLVCAMVGEFPELQGIMGGHYARAQGESEEVALAIAQHYRPQGPAEPAPAATTSIAVALADKLDTLAGFFARGIKPSGSRDPFALRRAGLGVIRIIKDNGLRSLTLEPVLQAALAPFATDEEQRRSVVFELLDFILERLTVHLRDEGIRHDVVAATSAVHGAGRDFPEDDVGRLIARTHALWHFLEGEAGASLLAGFRRASRILAIEERKDGTVYAPLEEGALALFDGPVQAEERHLAFEVDAAWRRIDEACAGQRFEDALACLTALREPVDRFFDHVMVNVEDRGLRELRLRLLSKLKACFTRIADFSLIEGTGGGRTGD